MEVYTFDLIHEQREVFECLNDPRLALSKYEISTFTDKTLGLMVNVILYMQERPKDDSGRTPKSRSLEFAGTSSELRDILSAPEVKVIKIHQIRDFTHIAFIVDYYFD